MKFVEKAFLDLFPDKNTEDFEFKIKYTDRFKPYNANVKYSRNKFQFNLSKKWRKISKEIQIGLIQSLFLKAFKEKKKTTNIDLYNLFMKNVHISIPKVDTEPILDESFNRVNEKYFLGLIEKPNVVWGNFSLRKLGHYEYGSDTISISKIFKESDIDILDYVMYHEMLHKKFKFHNENSRNFYHTKVFKDKEREFENSHLMENKISKFISKLKFQKPPIKFGGIFNWNIKL